MHLRIRAYAEDVTHAYIHVCDPETDVATVRRAVNLAGGRLASNPAHAPLQIVRARSSANVCAPAIGLVRLLVADEPPSTTLGFDDVIAPVLTTMVESFRGWLARADRASLKTIELTDDGVVIHQDGERCVRVTLWRMELALVRVLHEANGERRSLSWLLENVWALAKETKTRCVQSTVWNANQKIGPFGVRIEGSRDGWRLPRL